MTTVTLPTGVNGQTFVIVDGNGTAGTNNITVFGTGGQTINGAGSYIINTARGGAAFQYSSTGSGWFVVGQIGSGGGGSGTNFPVRTAVSSPVTVSASDFCVMTNLSVAGPVTVNLPAGIDGTVYAIVDAKGDASTNNITITPASGQINGASTYVINYDKGGVLIQYNATETQWKIPAQYTNNIFISPIISGGTATGTTLNNTSSGTIDVRDTSFQLRDAGDTTKIAVIDVNSTQTTGTTQTYVLPAAGTTIVGIASTQTLTNKTLTSPVINTTADFSNQAIARFYEQSGSGTNFIGISAPNAVTADKTFKLPDGDGSAGQVLKTDGSLNLGWASAVTDPTTTRGDLIRRGASSLERFSAVTIIVS